MPMKVREIIKVIQQDGWYEIEQKGSHRQYKHPVKKGKVTVPIHGLNEDLTPRTEKSILKQAGLI
jgi:predicted RNA binding protein YcfA (HicA-like mRNA interferase family)